MTENQFQRMLSISDSIADWPSQGLHITKRLATAARSK